MSFGASARIEVMIRIDGQNNAGGAVQQSDAQIKQLDESAQKAATHINIITERGREGFLGLGDGIQSAIGKVGFLTGAAKEIIGTIGELGEFIGEAAQKADRFDALEASVAGFEQRLESAKRASRGIIAEAELTKAMALFQSFNLPLDEFDRTLQAVIKTSIRTGESVTEMLDSMVRGIARESPMILDNLGIIVDMTAVTEGAAKAHGKLAEELTATERKAALLGSALTDLERQNISVDMTNARTTSIQRLGAAWEDLKDGIGEFLADVAVSVLDFFSDLFDTTSDTEKRILEMTERLPPAFASLANAAEAELGAVESAFKNATKAVETFQRTAGAVVYDTSRGATDTEKAAFNAKVAQIQKEEQAKYDEGIQPFRSRYENSTGYAQYLNEAPLKEASDRLAKVRDDAIAERTKKLRESWDKEIEGRKKTDKALEDEAKRHANEIKAIEEQALIDKGPLAVQEANAKRELAAAEEAHAKALKARNVADIAAANQRIEKAKQELALNEYAQQQNKPKRGGGRNYGEDYRVTLPDAPGRVRMIDESRDTFVKDTGDDITDINARAAAELADMAEKLDFVTRKAEAEAEALRQYMRELRDIEIDALFDDRVDNEQFDRITEAYQSAADKIRGIEHELQQDRVRAKNDAEEIIARRDAELEKAQDAKAKAARERDFETAEKSIRAADMVLATFFKNDKQLAIARIPLALAEAGLAAARGDYFGLAMGLWSATQFGIVAATGGGGRGGGAKGTGTSQTQEATPYRAERGPVTNVFNLGTGFMFGTVGELGAMFTGAVRVAEANGFSSGAI